jgi:hypothetical protein
MLPVIHPTETNKERIQEKNNEEISIEGNLKFIKFKMMMKAAMESRRDTSEEA